MGMSKTHLGSRREPVSNRRNLYIAALLWAPTAIALALLVAFDRLGAGAAFIAGLGVLAAVAVMVRPGLAAVAALRGHLGALARGGNTSPPKLRYPAEARALLIGISRLHRAWAASRERFESERAADASILENLPDPVITLDAARRVTGANHAARALLGAGATGRDLAVTLRNPAVLEAAELVLAGGAARSVEFVLPVPVERIFDARIEPTADDGGGDGDSRAVVVLHDLTAFKRVEQMRADFVANASHELRTPLSTLSGFIETLRGPGRDDEEARDRFLAMMQNQAARMSRLVDDLLALSRIELNEHTPPSDKVDLLPLLRDLAGTYELKATAKGMTIEIAATGATAVAGDRDELLQLFQNLVDNAVKYGGENSAVTVSIGPTKSPPAAIAARDGGETLTVAITDGGEGIDEDHLPRLTERFYRVDTARSRELGGTGLGLAIVKHIVSRHRGALTIASDIGRGSTFTVYLPIYHAPEAAEK